MTMLESSLPHRGVAVLITRVAAQSAATITAAARVPAAHPLVRAGRAPAIVAVEAAAQATALLGATGPGARGYLVGVPRCALAVADLAADAPFVVTVEHLYTEGPLSHWSFRATREATDIATGELSIWREP